MSNLWKRLLIGPSSERLLQLQPGDHVLEIACGNEVFTRRMAQLGVHVVATDFSEQLLALAQKRSTEFADRIAYRLADATDEAQLLALGERRFDAAVCNMAMMDMATIDPLMSALSRLLKTDGRFVFSIMHPCFNSGSTFSLEEEDREGDIIEVYSVKISKYLNLSPQKGLGIIGQPTPHYYFYRPLHVLFNTCFRVGFVIDALEEPALRPEDQDKGTR